MFAVTRRRPLRPGAPSSDAAARSDAELALKMRQRRRALSAARHDRSAWQSYRRAARITRALPVVEDPTEAVLFQVRRAWEGLRRTGSFGIRISILPGAERVCIVRWPSL